MASAQTTKLPLPELLRAAAAPYRFLLGFLTPYKSRFALALLCGVGFALLNAMLPLVIYFVAREVFGAEAGQGTDAAEDGGGPLANLPEPVADFFSDFRLPEWLRVESGYGGVLLACVLVPLVMILRSILSYGNSYFMSWVGFRMLRDVRRSVFAHMMSQSIEFFNRAKSGKLISRITNDARVAQSAFLNVAADIFKEPVNVIAGIAVMLYLDWRFCLVAVVLFPVCLVPVLIFGRKVRKAGKAEEEQAGAMSVILQETFAGIRIIKSFAREEYQTEHFHQASDKQFRNSMKVRKSMDVVQPLIETVSAFGVSLALLYIFFAEVELAKVVALLFGTFLLYEPMKKVSRMHLTIQKGLAASTNIFKIMGTHPAIADSPEAVDLRDVRGAIEFDKVTFSYGNDVSALNEVTLRIEPGKQYALVGHSGAGKTTILSLLLRLYDPGQGVVRLDGIDLRSIRQRSLREHIGLVSQEMFLFHDTIGENIRFGRLDATLEEVEEAAKLAHAHEFILAQPNGYKTMVGDKGCLLSGGQQQRLSIARAILKNAPILLLDEATSALDSESERMIQSALDRLTRGRTVIAIAHRLSTVLKSDQIVVMDAGRVADTGTHAELLERSPVYRKLYELQFHHHEDPLAVQTAML